MYHDNWKPKKNKTSVHGTHFTRSSSKNSVFLSQAEDNEHFLSVLLCFICCGVTHLILPPARAEEEGAGVADVTHRVLEELMCRHVSCSVHSWHGWKLCQEILLPLPRWYGKFLSYFFLLKSACGLIYQLPWINAQQGLSCTSSSGEEKRAAIGSSIILLLCSSNIFQMLHCLYRTPGTVTGSYWGTHNFVNLFQAHFYKMKTGMGTGELAQWLGLTGRPLHKKQRWILRKKLTDKIGEHVVLGICSCAGWNTNRRRYLKHFDKTFLLHGQPPKTAATFAFICASQEWK